MFLLSIARNSTKIGARIRIQVSSKDEKSKKRLKTGNIRAPLLDSAVHGQHQILSYRVAMLKHSRFVDWEPGAPSPRMLHKLPHDKMGIKIDCAE